VPAEKNNVGVRSPYTPMSPPIPTRRIVDQSDSVPDGFTSTDTDQSLWSTGITWSRLLRLRAIVPKIKFNINSNLVQIFDIFLKFRIIKKLNYYKIIIITKLFIPVHSFHLSSFFIFPFFSFIVSCFVFF